MEKSAEYLQYRLAFAVISDLDDIAVPTVIRVDFCQWEHRYSLGCGAFKGVNGPRTGCCNPSLLEI